MPWGAAIAAGAALAGSYMQGEAAKSAAEKSAEAQRQAAQIGADAAKFTPIGVTTRFGKSEFSFDPSGKLNQAGYTLSPELQQQQDMLMGLSNQGLEQYAMGEQYARPMLEASQQMMGLGQQYLGTSPQEQAAKYMANQQALLNPDRLAKLAEIRNTLQQQGRAGLSVGGDAGTLATNPEMAAYYNALARQDAELAAQADLHGMDYARFGAGMLGSGGTMLRDYYGAQTAAFAPYSQALQGAQAIEGLGQQAMDLGTQLGTSSSTAGARAGGMLAEGLTGAARTQMAGDAYSPWGSMLSGAGQMGMNYINSPRGQSMWATSPSTKPYQETDFGPGGLSMEQYNTYAQYGR